MDPEVERILIEDAALREQQRKRSQPKHWSPIKTFLIVFAIIVVVMVALWISLP